MLVTVQAHMPFGGKARKPGDVIPQREWLAASDTARRALVNQGLVNVSGGGEQTAGRRSIGESEGETDAIMLLQGIAAKLDRVLGHLGLKSEDLELPAAASVARAGKRKASAKRKRK